MISRVIAKELTATVGQASGKVMAQEPLMDLRIKVVIMDLRVKAIMGQAQHLDATLDPTLLPVMDHLLLIMGHADMDLPPPLDVVPSVNIVDTRVRVRAPTPGVNGASLKEAVVDQSRIPGANRMERAMGLVRARGAVPRKEGVNSQEVAIPVRLKDLHLSLSAFATRLLATQSK